MRLETPVECKLPNDPAIRIGRGEGRKSTGDR